MSTEDTAARIAAIERWADDHFTQGEVAVVMRLVTEFGFGFVAQAKAEALRDAADDHVLRLNGSTVRRLRRLARAAREDGA